MHMQVAVRVLRDAQRNFDTSKLTQAVDDARKLDVDDAIIHCSHDKLQLLRKLGVPAEPATDICPT